MIDMSLVPGCETRPCFFIEANDKDITTDLASRLISLTHTDNNGFEADQLELQLDDADGLVVLPNRGVVLSLKLGWNNMSPVLKGKFTVDEVEHSGAPDKLIIRARSADFRNSLTIKREQSWHDITIRAMIEKIASNNKLTPAVGNDLADLKIEHIDQTNETDASFLARLAKEYGALTTVKNDRLIFARQGQGKTVGGTALPTVTIERSCGDKHSFSIKDRDAYTGVRAAWLDTRQTQQSKTVQVQRTAGNKNTPAQGAPYLVGEEGKVLVLSRIYQDEQSAKRAAKQNWERIQRGTASFSIVLAKGRENLYPEMPVKVTGFKKPIDQAEWIITKIINTINNQGFTSSLNLEVRISDGDIEQNG